MHRDLARWLSIALLSGLPALRGHAVDYVYPGGGEENGNIDTQQDPNEERIRLIEAFIPVLNDKVAEQKHVIEDLQQRIMQLEQANWINKLDDPESPTPGDELAGYETDFNGNLESDRYVGVTTNVEAGYLGETGASGVLRTHESISYIWVPDEDWITLSSENAWFTNKVEELINIYGYGQRPFDIIGATNGDSVITIRGDLEWSAWVAGVQVDVTASNGVEAAGNNFTVNLGASTMYVWLEIDARTDNDVTASIHASTTMPDGTSGDYLDANGLRNAIEILPLWIIGISNGFNKAGTYDMRNNYNIYRLG